MAEIQQNTNEEINFIMCHIERVDPASRFGKET
jgi:hypothetical protein